MVRVPYSSELILCLNNLMLLQKESIPNVNHFDHLTSACFEMVLRRLGKKDPLSTNFEREVLYSGCSTLE